LIDEISRLLKDIDRTTHNYMGIFAILNEKNPEAMATHDIISKMQDILEFVSRKIGEAKQCGIEKLAYAMEEVKVVRVTLEFHTWKKLIVVPWHQRKEIYVFSCVSTGVFKYVYSLGTSIPQMKVELMYHVPGYVLSPFDVLKIKEKIFGGSSETEAYMVYYNDASLPLGETLLPVSILKIGMGEVEKLW